MYAPSADDSLTTLFTGYAGQEIPLVEVPDPHPFGGFSERRFELADENNPVLTAMRETAQRNGLILRIYFGDTPRIAPDYCRDRINAKIAYDGEGKYRVQPDFHMG